MTSYQPKTGVRCSCKRGVERDNCPTCEGTGMVIDFAAIRAESNVRWLKQDDGERDYTCSKYGCNYDGDTYCQNCGFAKGERR